MPLVPCSTPDYACDYDYEVAGNALPQLRNGQWTLYLFSKEQPVKTLQDLNPTVELKVVVVNEFACPHSDSPP